MMRIVSGYQKYTASILVFAMLVASTAIPISVFAQTSSPNSGQAGGTLQSLVQDTTGAVLAATIACNKNKISSAIKDLLSSDDTKAAVTNTASSASKTTTGSSANADQLVHFSNTPGSSGSNLQSIANSSQAQSNKITCTNAIERAAVGVILRQLTISTVNWINHGFNGNPLYSKDTGSLLKNIGNQSVKNFNSLIGFDKKNYPFGKAVAQSMVNQINASFEARAKYSLDRVIAQQYPGMSAADFQRDFAVGGWNALLSQTSTNNNPFGFGLAAQDELARRTAGTGYSPAQNLKDALAQSGGFLPIRTCAAPSTYDPMKSDQIRAAAQIKLNALVAGSATNVHDAAAAERVAKATAADAAAADAYAKAAALAQTNPTPANIAAAKAAAAALAAADAESAAANAALLAADQADAAANAAPNADVIAQQKIIAANTCSKWQTQTPGTVIAHALNTTLDIPSNQLINGQDLSTDITAIFNALENQLVNKGLSALSSPDNAPNTNFAKNSTGIDGINFNEPTFINKNGSWSSQGSNFNVFTDIPSIIRYEDNSQDDKKIATGCTSTAGFSPTGHYCSGEPTLPEGYQQILAKEVTAGQTLVANIYALDYCIPGPHPGWQNEITANAESFVSNPELFPASDSPSDMHKFLASYGTTVGVVAGAVVAGALAGSVVPGIGNAIGAVVGLIVGLILQKIGSDNNRHNEAAYGPIMTAFMGVQFEQKGGGREHVNGHDNSANIITTLAGRYLEAMQMVYAPTQSAVSAADALALSDPSGNGSTAYDPTLTSPTAPSTDKSIPDLSTTNLARAKIMDASFNAFSDIPDIIALDAIEFPKIQDTLKTQTQNKALLNQSISVESQLERLLVRIQNLKDLQGYPGVNGSLDLVPIITLLGNKTLTLHVGDTYTDAGATAVDGSTGSNEDLTDLIVTVNNVDPATPGVYTITYDVTDRSKISAQQVTRTVRVLDAGGNVGDIVPNYAAGANSADTLLANTGSIPMQTADVTTVVSAPTVRDYNKDLLEIQNVTNVANLTDYEIELKRISNTFSQIAPYIHGSEDLKQEEAVLDTITNESGNIATYKADGTLKNGVLFQCINDTSSPKSRYIKDGGPTQRLNFVFINSTDNTIQQLPKWLTDALPPSQSFLPEWHYAQGSGVVLYGRNPFPNDGEPPYPAGVNETESYFPNYQGHVMTGSSGIGTDQHGGPVKLDYDKLIRSDDISTINLQPVTNALRGLEQIVWIY